MSINSCQKGKRIERELAAWLRANGCPSAGRTQQYCGDNGTSDVKCTELPSFHLESKGTKSGILPTSTLRAWYNQLTKDCPEWKIPVIFHLANNEDWVGIMKYEDYEKLYKYPLYTCMGGSSVNMRHRLHLDKLERKVNKVEYPGYKSYAFEFGDDKIFIFAEGKQLLDRMIGYQEQHPANPMSDSLPLIQGL